MAAAELVIEQPLGDREAGAATYDAYAVSHGGEAEHNPDHCTNLSLKPQVRAAQWDQIEEHERSLRVDCTQGPPRLAIYYERAPELFDLAVSRNTCPQGLRELITQEQRRVAVGKSLSKRSANLGVHWANEGAPAAHFWLQQLPGWDDDAHRDRRLSRMADGRAVLTHVAGEIEYPAIFARRPDCRANIRRGLSAHLNSLRNAGDDPDDGSILPVAVYDHLPDALNDRRNIHCHFIMGTRRAIVDEDESLTFAERKVDAITRLGFVERLRVKFSELANIELQRIDADHRLHPGTYVEMGIEGAEPNKKMFGRATVLERAGVSTTAGLSNDIEGWDRRFERAQKRHDDRVDAIAVLAVSEAARDMLGRAAAFRYEAEQIGLLVGMSVSRAKRTARFAPAYADAAKREAGKQGWLSRREEARDYLRQLDIELAPERAAIVEHRREAARLDRAAHDLSLREAQAREGSMLRSITHRAIDLIITTPLLITERNGAYLVDRHDDRENLMTGVDLASPEAQRRLRSCHVAQQRELTQVRSFTRKYGHTAMFDKRVTNKTAWLQSAIERWRSSPLIERDEVERLSKEDAHRAMLVARNRQWTRAHDDVDAHVADGRITLIEDEVRSEVTEPSATPVPEEPATLASIFSLVPPLTPFADLPKPKSKGPPRWHPGPALPVPAAVSAKWRAAGMGKLASDIAAFELVLSARPKQVAITDGRLTDALGDDAARLVEPAIHDRLLAVWLYQQMTRRELVAARAHSPVVTAPEPNDQAGDLVADRVRHSGDEILAEMLDAAGDSDVALRSTSPRTRLLRTAMAAIDGGEGQGVCRVLADAAIAQAGGLVLRRALLSDHDDQRLWNASSMPAKSINRRRPGRGRSRLGIRGMPPDYPGRR